MPEESYPTDNLDLLWTPSPDGDDNLILKGVDEDRIERVGNRMIDSLEMTREKIEKQGVLSDYGLKKEKCGVVTSHRPANVENPELLSTLCSSFITTLKKYL